MFYERQVKKKLFHKCLPKTPDKLKKNTLITFKTFLKAVKRGGWLSGVWWNTEVMKSGHLFILTVINISILFCILVMFDFDILI